MPQCYRPIWVREQRPDRRRHAQNANKKLDGILWACIDIVLVQSLWFLHTMPANIKEKIKHLLQKVYFLYARDLDVSAGDGPIVVIAPHADDETLGCGATIARLRATGRRVRITIVTDGAASVSANSVEANSIVDLRHKEAVRAAEILGVARKDVIFLNIPDGNAAAHADEIVSALAGIIRESAPAHIFSPYGHDLHPDHRAVAAAVNRLRRNGVIVCPVYEYPVWFWPRIAFLHLLFPFRLARLRRIATDGFLARKRQAIEGYRSQYDGLNRANGNFVFPPGFVELFLTPHEIFFEQKPDHPASKTVAPRES